MKIYKTYYITEQLYKLKQYLIGQAEVTNVVFMRRAIEHYLKTQAPEIDRRILITKRTDSQYVKRDKVDSCYFEEEQLVELQRIADFQKCKLSCVIFQVLVSYCAVNSKEIEVNRE